MSSRIIFAFLITITSFQKTSAQNAKVDNALFWEISGNGMKKPSYLFGTYHLLNSGFLETIPKVKTAFENSDGVVVETELDSSMMMKMMFLMVMQEKKISDLISEEDYALVSKEVLESTGAPMEMMGQFKPTFISLMLTLAYNQKENGEILKKYEGQPLDSHFASTARKKNKPVNTFETMEEQVKIVFDHDPVEKQAEQLVEYVRMKDEVIKLQGQLLNLYITGDLNGLAELFKKYEEKFGDTAYLADERNLRWMEKLPGFLAKENQFIGVGAFHLTGEKGLVNLLRKKGYKLKPMATK